MMSRHDGCILEMRLTESKGLHVCWSRERRGKTHAGLFLKFMKFVSEKFISLVTNPCMLTEGEREGLNEFIIHSGSLLPTIVAPIR